MQESFLLFCTIVVCALGMLFQLQVCIQLRLYIVISSSPEPLDLQSSLNHAVAGFATDYSNSNASAEDVALGFIGLAILYTAVVVCISLFMVLTEQRRAKLLLKARYKRSGGQKKMEKAVVVETVGVNGLFSGPAGMAALSKADGVVALATNPLVRATGAAGSGSGSGTDNEPVRVEASLVPMAQAPLAVQPQVFNNSPAAASTYAMSAGSPGSLAGSTRYLPTASSQYIQAGPATQVSLAP
jgi:hypothetical protein